MFDYYYRSIYVIVLIFPRCTLSIIVYEAPTTYFMIQYIFALYVLQRKVTKRTQMSFPADLNVP